MEYYIYESSKCETWMYCIYMYTIIEMTAVNFFFYFLSYFGKFCIQSSFLINIICWWIQEYTCMYDQARCIQILKQLKKVFWPAMLE